MSELAYNINGEGFDVPETATGWRVRRMKPRGAPEVVYSRDGIPLVVPIESDLEELRRSVDAAGRFRLDAVDDRGRNIEDVPASYVVVSHKVPEEPVAVAEAAKPAVISGVDGVIAEAMRLNTELARSVIDRFPEMMQAAATLLRAADGAGLPARPGTVQSEEDNGSDDDSEDQAPARGGLDINAIIAQVATPLLMAVASGDKSRLPSFAEMLNWQKAVPKKKQANDASTESATPAPKAPNVAAVLAELTPEERALAMGLAHELSAEERQAWFDELAPLSVPDAVAKIRKVLSSTKSAGGGS